MIELHQSSSILLQPCRLKVENERFSFTHGYIVTFITINLPLTCIPSWLRRPDASQDLFHWIQNLIKNSDLSMYLKRWRAQRGYLSCRLECTGESNHVFYPHSLSSTNRYVFNSKRRFILEHLPSLVKRQVNVILFIFTNAIHFNSFDIKLHWCRHQYLFFNRIPRKKVQYSNHL